MIAKILTLVIHEQWDTNAMAPSSLSQLARNRFSSSIVAIPVEFNLDDSSTVLGSHSATLADI